MEISAVIITGNEEKRLEAALKSVADIASEIIVVDSHSTDGTLKIARRYTSRVYERAWTHWADQKNYADSLASFPWILSLDADERIAPELRDEILELKAGEPECAAFSIPRRVYYLGGWVRHSGWCPDRRVRLFRKDGARWEGDAVADRLRVDGRVGKLAAPIHHFPYANIAAHVAGINSLSSREAQKLYAQKKKSRFFQPFVAPLASFLDVYVLKLGFMDGLAGFVIAGLEGYAAFLRSAKLREIWKKGVRIEPFPY